MSKESMDVTAEYETAQQRANRSDCNFGEEIADLPSVRRFAFVHGYAQCLIDQRRAAIAAKPKIPALQTERPSGCQCAPSSWGVEGYLPICTGYEKCQYGDCKHCNHDEACHSVTDQPLSEEVKS